MYWSFDYNYKGVVANSQTGKGNARARSYVRRAMVETTPVTVEDLMVEYLSRVAGMSWYENWARRNRKFFEVTLDAHWKAVRVARTRSHIEKLKK